MTQKSHDVALRVALFPGSFNPFTLGHKSVVDRVLPLFDRVVIAVGYNEAKGGDGAGADDRAEAIRRVYREGMANRFLASFTRFVARHIDRPELDELVCEAFRAFVRRNLAHYPADAEVSALGGVACHFERQLRHVLATEGLRAGRIVETPDEGLLNYHIWNRSE